MKTLKELELAGKRVLVRVDFNVPMNESGEITDDLRIRTALPTLRYLVEQRARVIICTHMGRPKGQRVEKIFARTGGGPDRRDARPAGSARSGLHRR